MADFDLTQTDAQVQSILNDGQNMQGAGAQTTLTTESVLLKDVNGNYHKILKSSFTEAIRDTLAGLLVNNDKGTTINQIAAIANGDFGSITPANLASVLGVATYGKTKSLGTNQAALETEFQEASIYTSFDVSFGGADQEGRVLAFKHDGTTGEGIWITRFGIFIVARNNSLDDGTWRCESIYSL